MAAGSIVIDLLMKTGSFETDTKRAEKRLKDLDNQIKGFGKSVVAVGATAAAAFAVMAKKNIDAMDNLAKAAQSVGVTTESLSALGYAAELAGVDADTLTNSMSRLAKGMSDAQQGTGEALKAFQALNLDPSGFSGTDDALIKISDKFAQFQDGAEKTALAIALFGRSGAQLIPFLNSGADGIEEMRKEAERLGIVISGQTAKASEEFNDNISRLGKSIDGFVISIVSDLLPALSSFVEKLTEISIEVKGTNWSAFMPDRSVFAADDMDEAASNAVNLKNKITQLQEAMNNGTAGLFASQSLAALNAQLEKAQDLALRLSLQSPLRFDDTEGIVERKPSAPKITGDKKTDAQKQAESIAKMLEDAKKLNQTFNDNQKIKLEELKTQDQLFVLSNNEREIQQSINDVLKETTSELQRILEKRREAAEAGASVDILRQFDVEMEMISETGKRWAELTGEQKRLSLDAQMTFAFGWERAFAQFAEDASNYAQKAGDMMNSFTSNLTTAIDNFVETGKLSFSDFASSVIKDLIKIELRMRAMQLFRSLIGVVGSAIGNVTTAATYGTNVGSEQTAMLQAQDQFAMGGFTGYGGKYEPAGIVHKGEYVLNAAATQRIGKANLDMMNGYANGGYVGNAPNMASGSNVQVNIINQSSQPVQAQQSSPRFDGTRFVQDIILTDLRRNGPIGQALRAG